MKRTYEDIQQQVGRNIQDTSSAMQVHIKDFINDAYFEALDKMNWNFINPEHKIAVVVGVRQYGLPRDFRKEIKVYDVTNNILIPFEDFQRTIENDPAEESVVGNVCRYTMLNDQPVLIQPAIASVITVSSSSAFDVTQTVLIRGIVNGYEITEELTLNGTNDVDGVLAFTRIIQLSKSAETIGRVLVAVSGSVVEIVDAVGGNIIDAFGNIIVADTGDDTRTLAVFSPEVNDYRVDIIQFYMTPGTAITINIPYLRDPLPLNKNLDIPLIRANIIEQGATARAWRFSRQYQKADIHEIKFNRLIDDAMFNQANQPNQPHTFNVQPYSRETV